MTAYMPLNEQGAATEAVHQNALLEALFSREHNPAVIGTVTTSEGVAIYQNNGALNAIRALSLMFPAVFALLGETDFAGLARQYWRASPPQRGDWSQYGQDFGDWIAAHNPGGVLDELSFLPALARLDDALSRCQDAPDVAADLATLANLKGDPALCCIVLHPSVTLLDLDYDVLNYRSALLGQSLDQQSTNAATVAQGASPVVVARQNWRAIATSVDAASAAFVRNCLLGATVLKAHDAACAIQADFDAAHWLSQAIPAQWLLRVKLVSTQQLP